MDREHLGSCIHCKVLLSEDLIDDMPLIMCYIIFQLCTITGIIRIQKIIVLLVEFCHFLKMNIKSTAVRI